MQTFAIYTLGCKVNLFESQAIANQLTTQGMIAVDFKTQADVYIINTCSVTNTADLKSRNIIRRARKLNPQAIIIVAGCYSQIASQSIMQQLDVQIVIGNKYKNQVYELLQQYTKTLEPITQVDNLLKPQTFEQLSLDHFDHHTRAFIKIQDGCNFMCSYCSIPFTRGRQSSAKLKDVLTQIKQLVQQGYLEIVLTGVNTAGFNDGDHDFYALLLAISEIPGNFRVRISSVEPFQITDDIIDLLTSRLDRFCNHWHLCLQSGSNQVLQAMQRHYTIEQFQSLVTKIRSRSPLVCISTDYIVGFPTETNQDHLYALQTLQALKLVFMHIFTYSPRSQTPAASLVDLHGDVKKQRFLAIEQLNQQMTKEYLSKFIGLEIKVLFEEYKHGVASGKSSEYCDVLLKTDRPEIVNQLVTVKIIKLIKHQLIGELV